MDHWALTVAGRRTWPLAQPLVDQRPDDLVAGRWVTSPKVLPHQVHSDLKQIERGLECVRDRRRRWYGHWIGTVRVS